MIDTIGYDVIIGYIDEKNFVRGAEEALRMMILIFLLQETLLQELFHMDN